MKWASWLAMVAVSVALTQGCVRRGVNVTAVTPAAVAVAPPAVEPAAVAPEKSQIPAERLQIPQELETCAAHFRTIDAAIRKYEKEKGKLPDWLSDLVPAYLSNDTLFCPNDSEHKNAYLPDPNIPCSYSYEFCLIRYGDDAGALAGKTAQEWKKQQVKLFGPVVPLVRCHSHGELTLNLGLDGKIYVSPLNWETMFMPDYQTGMESKEK